MLVLDQLEKSFVVGDASLLAVNALSLTVAPGEVFGLLGSNGAGKTTTLRMVMGLVRPDGGDATVDGISVRQDPIAVKRRLGFISATDGVYPWLTVREMLRYFADLYRVPPAIAESHLSDLSRLMGITSLMDRRAGSLSTGQRQRVTLVRGLIHDPPVVLMDEPTRGLDVTGVKTIFRYIESLRSLNKAVVVCTHRLDEAQRLCDRFGLLHRGRLLHTGSLDDLRRQTGRNDLVDMFFDIIDDPSSGQTSPSTSPPSTAFDPVRSS